MALSAIFICPHCGKPPVLGTDPHGNVFFACCPQGGARQLDDVAKLPTKPPDASDPTSMPNLRP